MFLQTLWPSPVDARISADNWVLIVGRVSALASAKLLSLVSTPSQARVLLDSMWESEEDTPLPVGTARLLRTSTPLLLTYRSCSRSNSPLRAVLGPMVAACSGRLRVSPDDDGERTNRLFPRYKSVA